MNKEDIDFLISIQDLEQPEFDNACLERENKRLQQENKQLKETINKVKEYCKREIGNIIANYDYVDTKDLENILEILGDKE